MPGQRCDHDEASTGRQHTGEFRRVAGSENIQDDVEGSVSDRQRAPDVPDQAQHLRQGTCRPAQCIFGDVQGQRTGSWNGLQHRVEVETGARTGVGNGGTGLALHSPLRMTGNGPGQQVIVAAG